MNTAQAIKDSAILVIKIGTALIAAPDGTNIRQAWLATLAEDIAALIEQGKKIVIVSSGGIALGRSALGISPETPPQSIPLEQKQAASAVGQFHVFNGYYTAFNALGLQTAQVLLTMSETENRRMHLNARATLQALMDQGIIPVINENDTISTEEIRFGDNDRLAVRVAQMVGAECTLLLSTIDGLYSADPALDHAAHIPLVETITAAHTHMAGDAAPGLSTGGMKSKLEAAQAAMRSGISLVIADGQEEHCLRDLAHARTTLFPAQQTGEDSRKRWISAHMAPKGCLIIDDGALSALRDGKSLLPVGVSRVEGTFERGDAVEIKDLSGDRLGIGLSAYRSEDALKIIGKRSEEIATLFGFAGRSELVHRNDMALI